MARYQVSVIEAPADWEATGPDDVPPSPATPIEAIEQFDELFPAVRCAIEHNQKDARERAGRWAVVVEPGTPGRIWRDERICTPLTYKVTTIWWPEGWEPNSPSDVPNCVWKAEGQTDRDKLTYQEAVTTVRALNEQNMNHATTLWHVVIAVENEPLSQTVFCDPSGTETTVEVRRLHVVRPEEGGGRGDCSHCPAHAMECAKEDWVALEQDISETHTRPSVSES
jgi:hypothetical protein